MTLKLLRIWEERLKRVEADKIADPPRYILRKSTSYYAQKIHFVSSRQEARDIVEFAQQRHWSHIGLDTEFRYDRPGVIMDKEKTTQDPRSIHPLLLSMAFAEPKSAAEGNLYGFVFDLRNPDLIHEIEPILQLPVCYCGHNLKVEFFCLWQLKLPEPPLLWDTFIHEKALYLGKNHAKYGLKPGSEGLDEIIAKEEAKENEQFSYSLVATCQRYGVSYAMEGDKKRLQKSFLDHPDKAPFTEEQIQYAAEDAIAAARLYPLQVTSAQQAGILHHLITIEMPWTRANARIEWNGIRVDPDKRQRLLEVIIPQREILEKKLVDLGLNNTQSHKQLKEFFEKAGILQYFRQNGKYSFDRGQLKRLKHLHPVIPILRATRRALDLEAGDIMSPELVGIDGRIHPEHKQLGTHTGRQTSRWPNVLGLDGVLRPLIVPDPGRGIGEADWSQVEIGIAASIYHDSPLIEMFNTGDVYSAMAQYFFRDRLSAEDLALSGGAFKRKFPEYRNQMKSCTLGIIYGETPRGLLKHLI